MNSCNSLRAILMLSLALLLFGQTALAEDTAPAAPQEQAQPEAGEPKEPFSQLEETAAAMSATQQDLTAARQLLKRAKDEQEKALVNQDIERLTKRLNDQRLSFEKLATGGVDTRLFYEGAEAKFDLQQDFAEVVRPLLVELKRLTEHPRMLERLRGEQKYLQARLEVAQAALAKAESLSKSATAAGVKKELNALSEQWQQRHDDTASKLKLVVLQIDELLNPASQSTGRLGSAFADFFSGRGLSLLLGTMTFASAYFAFFAATGALKKRLLATEALRAQFWPRIVILAAQLAGLGLSVFFTMVVLYMRGDWLILALVIIFLFGGAWTLRQSLPRYLMESRILLNMGPVRDGERVIFRGIPWQITSLNVFSTLRNPCLRGATIRLSLGEMAKLHSRPFGRDEPWFPSREGDYVILDGEIYGRVLMQTPEIVQMQVTGSLKTFGVESYLAANPRNLTQGGFAVSITFGLDYIHQREITTTIVDAFAQSIRQRLEAHELGSHLVDMMADFSAAGASSLDIMIAAVFKGDAAEHYWALRRLLQRIALETCNQNDWVVPFNQLTVHVAEGSALPQPAITPWHSQAAG